MSIGGLVPTQTLWADPLIGNPIAGNPMVGNPSAYGHLPQGGTDFTYLA